jgi:hypothetical protein
VVSLPEADYRFRIADSSGHVLREIHAPFIDRVDYPNLSGLGSSEELRVIASPTNNTIAEIRTYCFTRRGGVRNILLMPDGFGVLRDLDHDGRPELLADDAAPLEWVDGLSHGCCPSVMLVLRWDGDRYVTANRRFQTVPLSKARKYREEFLTALRRFKDPQGGEVTRDDLLGPAIGYWANLATIGQQTIARRWLLTKLPEILRGAFTDSLPEVRERLAKIPEQITISQRRITHQIP